MKDLLIGMRIANEERDRLERMGIPITSQPFEGQPITDDLHQLFAPWGGRLSSVVVDPVRGIEVKYESGMEITFIPASIRT